jgi:7-carboxy-7-deazaguanine synthase (Cx14CxxC type)
MPYRVKEIYLTLQGEGFHAGRTAVFCRFTGCNLWSGRDEDRADATCNFCDTDFLGTNGPGGGAFPTTYGLADAVDKAWGRRAGERWVVFTGGEPALQLDAELIDAVRQRGFKAAVETNGTRSIPFAVDWLCVSPKPGAELEIRRGDELKLIYPVPRLDPVAYEPLDFDHFFLQPLDDAHAVNNLSKAAAYCLEHPKWRVSLQRHKFIGIK